MTTGLNRRQFLATSAATGTLVFLGPRALRAAPGGTLRFGLSAYPPSFEAWASTGTAAGTVKLMIHRGLLGYDPDGKMRGELAESWDVDADGVWTFKLRDATFHDGSPVTAEDIKWNIETAAAADSTAYFRGQMGMITSVETPDAKTVKLTTKSPIATLPGWFAHYNMPMLKKGSAHGQHHGRRPVQDGGGRARRLGQGLGLSTATTGPACRSWRASRPLPIRTRTCASRRWTPATST